MDGAVINSNEDSSTLVNVESRASPRIEMQEVVVIMLVMETARSS